MMHLGVDLEVLGEASYILLLEHPAVPQP